MFKKCQGGSKKKGNFYKKWQKNAAKMATTWCV